MRKKVNKNKFKSNYRQVCDIQREEKMKKILMYALVATMMAASVGCSKGKNTDGVTSASKAEVVEDDNSKEDTSNPENETHTKDEVTNNDGEEVRVIASSVAVVEILDKLGVPMVGVPTSSYTLPESVANATKIGNPMSPDVEVIKSLNPTVVVSVDSLSADLKTQFESLNIPTTFANLSSYTGLKTTIEELGSLFGKEAEATALVEDMVSSEESIAKSIEGKEAPNVLIIFGASGTFMTATENTYVGDLVKTVGANNVMSGTEGSFIPVDMEYLASTNPDYILLMAHANVEETLKSFEKEFETNVAWNNFTAVKEGRVIGLETGLFGMSANLKAKDALVSLVDILYAN